MLRFTNALLCVGLLPMAALASVPKQINHQGVVSVNGVAFDGTGLFRFAIVDPDAPANLWSNDGSITGAVGGIPTAAVSLTVTNGVYSVGLGDTTLTNMTDEISPSVFNDDNVVLRIWFDDGANGVQQLAPDHKLTTTPYSARLPNIFTDDNGNVGIGTTSPQGHFHVVDATDGSTFSVIETTGPVPLTGASLIFSRTGAAKKHIALDGIDDLGFFQGTGSNDSPANRMFIKMKESTGNTLFGGNVGIGIGIATASPLNNSTLNVQSSAVSMNQSVVNIGWIGSDDGGMNLLTLEVNVDGSQGGRRSYFIVDSVGKVTGKFGNYHVPSDARLKRNIVNIPNALERVVALRGINFKWNDTRFNEDSLQMGLIAQEVEEVFPEVVHTAKDKMGTKAVEYEYLIGALVEAIKELDGIVKQKDGELTNQRKRLASFESRLAALEGRLPKVAQTSGRE